MQGTQPDLSSRLQERYQIYSGALSHRCYSYNFLTCLIQLLYSVPRYVLFSDSIAFSYGISAREPLLLQNARPEAEGS